MTLYPSRKYLSLKEVLALLTIRKTTLYRGIEKGIYPKQVKVSPNRVGSSTEDLEKLFERLDNNVPFRKIR